MMKDLKILKSVELIYSIFLIAVIAYSGIVVGGLVPWLVFGIFTVLLGIGNYLKITKITTPDMMDAFKMSMFGVAYMLFMCVMSFFSIYMFGYQGGSFDQFDQVGVANWGLIFVPIFFTLLPLIYHIVGYCLLWRKKFLGKKE